MKKLKDKEFKMAVQNLLASEEHMIDMLNEENKDLILPLLRETKFIRNLMLDFPEEKDRNKWCTLKHFILSQYHILEMINSQSQKDFRVLQLVYKKLDDLIIKYIDTDVQVNCDVCVRDLIIEKIKESCIKKFSYYKNKFN